MNKRLLNIGETAKYLNVSVNTIYSWVCQRRIPFVKLGRRLLFDIEDLDRWIESQKINSEDTKSVPNRLSLVK